MYVTAYESVPPIFWIVPLAVLGGLLSLFVFIELFLISLPGKDTDGNKASISLKDKMVRVQEKSLATFGTLAIVVFSAIGLIWWNSHDDYTVELSSGFMKHTTVAEDQLRQWRGDEIGMNLVYSHKTKEGTPVFKDFSNPSKQVYRLCPLIPTDEQKSDPSVWGTREVKVKITPRCTNMTTDGENVPITMPKPTPTSSVSRK